MNVELIDHIVSEMKPNCVTNLAGFGQVLCFFSDDLVKLFRPRAKKKFGVQLIDGEVGFFVCSQPHLLDRQGEIESPECLTLVPLMNFPDIVRESTVLNNSVTPKCIKLVRERIEKIPDTATDLARELGQGFCAKNLLERSSALTRYLRA